jgi:hypothetical protein
MTSGEQPATSFTQDGGTRPRVLSLWGSPFEGTGQETGHLVNQLNQGVLQNYGHAGQRFVQYLQEHRDDWDGWCELYQQDVEVYESWAGNNAVARRMAPSLAVITMAAWLAHQALDLPWEYEDPIEPLWDELIQEAVEADRAAAALRHVMDWATAHQRQFFKRAPKGEEPPSGWAGRWDEKLPPVPGDSDTPSGWQWIGFVPAKLDSILREGGFEFESTVRAWADREWILMTEESDGTIRRRHKVRIGDEKRAIGVVAIKRSACDEVMPE